MTQTIAAAVLEDGSDRTSPYARSQPLHVKALELDPPGRGELLIRIEAAGLCHSDLSVVNGDRPRPTPMALGHEAVGVVEQLGDPDEAAFKVGDRVVLAFLPACGRCARCVGGEPWLCGPATAANGRGELLCGGVRLHDHGRPVRHHLGVSAFATHAVVDGRSAVKIARDIPPEIAALFGCAVLTGVGAVFNSANVRPGESLAIYGLGGVGLAALLGGLAAGAQPIVVVDPLEAKRALALEIGASAAASPNDAAEVFKGVLPDGADVVIESVGKAQVLAQAYAAGRRGARIVTVGLPNPAEQLTLPAVSLVAEAKTLIGSYMGSAVPARDIPRYIGLWRAGRLPVERLLSSVSPLAEINTLLDRLADGSALRQVVIPGPPEAAAG